MSNKLEEKDPQTNCTQNVEAFYKKKKINRKFYRFVNIFILN